MIEQFEANFTPTDYRRAAALMAHAASADGEGMEVVYRETVEAGQVLGMVTALLKLVLDYNPELCAPLGVMALQEVAQLWAAAEETVNE